MQKIINVNDILYETLGKMSISSADKKGMEYWKKQYHSDTVIRSGDLYYFCRVILEAEFE